MLKFPVTLVRAGSPAKSDIAFVSIDHLGTPGELNQFVLNELGYSLSDLPDAGQLRKGYALLERPDHVPVIFIVTIRRDDRYSNTAENMRRGLILALAECSSLLSGKRLWMPVMGTGIGGLSVDQSFDIVFEELLHAGPLFVPRSVTLSLPYESQTEDFNYIRKQLGVLEDLTDIKQPADAAELIFSKTPDDSFWWIKASAFFWDTGRIRPGSVRRIETRNKKGNRRRIYDHFFSVRTGDLVLAYETSPSMKVIGLFEITRPATDRQGDYIEFRLIHLFSKPVAFKTLERQTAFQQSEVSNYFTGTLFRLDFVEFMEIVGLTELNVPEFSEIAPKKFPYLIDNGKEALNVGLVADELCELLLHFSKNQEEGQMLGIFGRWGRGKTFLIRKIIEKLGLNYRGKNYDNDTRSPFILVKFNAWRYKTAETSWAHLYEVLASAYYSSGRFFYSPLYRRLRLNLRRLGLYDILTFFLPLLALAIAIPFIGLNLQALVLSLLGAGTIGAFYALRQHYGTKAVDLIKKYSTKKTFTDVLGIQAEVQTEIRKLLRTWLPTPRRKKQRPRKNKVLLVVDDVDRCGPENIVSMLDALRVMLEDEEIIKRVVVIIAIDERILKKAVTGKYSAFHFPDEEIRVLTREYIDKLFVTGIKLPDLDETEKEDVLDKYIDGKISLPKKNESGSEQQPSVQTPPARQPQEPETALTASRQPTAPDQQPVTVTETAQGKNTSQKPAEDFTEINTVELQLLKEYLRKLNNPTPRQIRIFYYRYLMSRNFALREGISKTFTTGDLSKDTVFIGLLLQMIVDRTNTEMFDAGEEDPYMDQTDLSPQSRRQLIKIVEMIVPY